MKLNYQPHTLYFKRPFKIAHGTRSSTPIVLIELNHNGFTGYGEACLPPYLGENHETVIQFLEKAKPLLESIGSTIDLPSTLQLIDSLSPGNSAAKACIDIALHDLIGKMKGLPCWKLFGADKNDTPYTTYTIGMDEPDVITEKLKEARSFKILKVKLNGEDDRSIIHHIRKHTTQPIAVDVNQGWKKKEQALEMIHWLKDQHVLFVEQALPKENWDDAAWLYEKSPLPLFADESIQRYSDLNRVKDCFHGINIKLMKCTGLHEAHRMILKARELKLKLLIGCMSETSCAVSAAAQLTPFVDYADLDGPLLIKDDPFNGIVFNEGKITLNDQPGIGVVKR